MSEHTPHPPAPSQAGTYEVGRHDAQAQTTRPIRDILTDIQSTAFFVGVGALGLCILAALLIPSERNPFYESYLWSYLFWTGLTLGCGGLAMLHNLTGGRWGQAIKRILLAGNSAIYLMALLILPLFIAALTHRIWPWAMTDLGASVGKPLGPHKAIWLAPQRVYLRVVIYFAIWFGFNVMLTNAARRIEATNSFPVRFFYSKLSAFGLLLYVLTVTFAVIDGVMSLEPNWYSTMYGLIYVAGQILSTFSFCCIVLVLLNRHRETYAMTSLDMFNDVGSFMFAWTILWAYTSFFQFLISWMGDLQVDMHWYVKRTVGPWHVVTAFLILFQFFAPFLALLNRRVKRNPRILLIVGCLIMFVRLVDLYWTVKPAFPEGSRVSWMDLFTPFGIGGLFIWAFIGRLKNNPLTPPPTLPGDTLPSGHGHAAFSRAAAIAQMQGAQHV